MKLLSSIKKELILATRSFYFYIELFFAVVLLVIVMFAIPEETKVIQTEYVYLSDQVAAQLIEMMLEEDKDIKLDSEVLKAGGESFDAMLITILIHVYLWPKWQDNLLAGAITFQSCQFMDFPDHSL